MTGFTGILLVSEQLEHENSSKLLLINQVTNERAKLLPAIG